MCLVTLNVRSFGHEKLAEIKLARKIVQGQTDASQQPQTAPSHHMQSVPSPQVSQTPVARPVCFQQQQVKIGELIAILCVLFNMSYF